MHIFDDTSCDSLLYVVDIVGLGNLIGIQKQVKIKCLGKDEDYLKQHRSSIAIIEKKKSIKYQRYN